MLYVSAYAYPNGINYLKTSNTRNYSSEDRQIVFSSTDGNKNVYVDNIYNTKRNYISKVTRIPNEDIYRIINVPNREQLEMDNINKGNYCDRVCLFYIETTKIINILLRNGIPQDTLEEEFYSPSARFKNILMECPEIHHEIYKLIKNVTNIPFIEEWVQYVLTANDRALRISWSSAIYDSLYSSNNIYAAIVKINNNEIKNTITNGLKAGRISINGCRAVSNVSSGVRNLTDYLGHFSNQLITKASNKFTACFDPEKDQFTEKEKDFFEYADYFGKLKLYNAQKNVIAAVSRALNKNRSAFVVGEMGSGIYICQ